jgi:hypothetical protein
VYLISIYAKFSVPLFQPWIYDKLKNLESWPGKCAGIHLRVGGIDVACFIECSIVFWNCFDSVVFVACHFIYIPYY